MMDSNNSLLQDMIEDEEPKNEENQEQGLNEKENVPQEIPQPTFSGTITVLNLLNSFLGTLITNNAYSFVGAGFVGTILITLIFATISYGISYMMLKLAKETNTNGINALSAEILGRVGSFIYCILNIFYLFWYLTNCLSAAGEIIVHWIELSEVKLSRWAGIVPNFIYSLIPVCLTLPVRQNKILQYFSIITIFCVIFYLIIMFVKMGIYLHNNHSIHSYCQTISFNSDFYLDLPYFVLYFPITTIFMPSLRLYKKRSFKKYNLLVLITIIIAFLIFNVSGITGYVTTAGFERNIFRAFDRDDVLMAVTLASILLIVTCSYPIVCRSMMNSWSQLICKNENYLELTKCKTIIVIFLSNFFPFVFGTLNVSTIKVVNSIWFFLAVAFMCILNYIYPPIMWFFYYKRKEGKICNVRNILGLILVLLGITLIITSGVGSVHYMGEYFNS